MAARQSKKAKKKKHQARQVQARRATKRPTERTARRATWSGLLVESGMELREALPVDETGYLQVAGASHADARAYFMYAVSDELLATGASILRWLKLLEDMEEPGQETDRFWSESIVAEQSGCVRKLVEVLLDLILFQETNEDAYYRHVLLLRDLDAARGTQEDLLTFYACPNRNIENQVQRLASEVVALEASGDIDLARCWYLNRTTASSAAKLAKVAPGRQISSVRARLRSALRMAKASEKLSLGVSYDRLYSRTSKHIHFTPASKDGNDVAAVSSATDECGILGLDIIVALQRLLGSVPGKYNQQVRDMLDNNPYPAQLSDAVTIGTACIGDFVLAYGDLAEVLDIAESDFGYKSYKVLYLAGGPKPHIAEDWFPAQTVRVLFSRSALTALVSDMVASGEVPDELGQRLTSASGDEHFRAAVTELWDGVLRHHPHSTRYTPPPPVAG